MPVATHDHGFDVLRAMRSFAASCFGPRAMRSFAAACFGPGATLGFAATRFGPYAMLGFAVTCFGLFATLSAPTALAQQAADTIVTHGKILTVDAAFRTVEALAITNDRIVAAGTSTEIARYAGAKTKVIDVAGATVIPGLIDNHFHFTRGVETWHEQARFEGVDSRREALRILAAKAASLKPGDWIMVQGGWTPAQFADAPGGFTLEELDGVAPKNPLFVQQGYAIVYANSLALKAVGLNPADGARRSAQGLVSFQPPYALYDAMPRTSPAQRDQNLTDFMRELNSTGLTGVYSLGQSDFLAARAAKGPLPVRLWETLNFNATDPASAAKAAELIARTRPNQFDGQHGLFGLGEVLYGPFFDLAPRKEPWPTAIMSEYGKLATAAARAGWHVHQHVINNNAVTDLLDTLEAVNKTQPLTNLRWTLGHIYDISPANIARAKALGMTLGVHGAAMQAGAHMPLRQIADSGIVFGLGTDATIVSHYSPFVTLGWVVSGLDVGGNKVLDQTLTREEALIAHTRSNAYLFFQEKTLGSLEVGKQADLVVLDRDYMTVPAADIRRIKPRMTMVGGRVVFETAPLQPVARTADSCADMRPGLNPVTVISAGKPQRFDLMLPASFSPTKSVPLVIGLHPSGGTGSSFDQDAGLSASATGKGFAVMLPDGGIQQSPSDGNGHYWNIPGVPLIGGGAVPEGTRDDVRFIADAIDHLVKHNCVDARRIYVTGFSGGARMSSTLGCRLADRIAAVAPVAGLRAGRAAAPDLTEPDANDCRPSRPLAVLAVHGTDDPTNPFPGGEGVRWGYSVERAAARWASLDHCDASPALERISTHVTRVRYGTCRAGSEVALYRIDAPRDQGGGHVWPGGRRDLSTRAPSTSGGNTSGPGGQPAAELDATAVVLEFFARH